MVALPYARETYQEMQVLSADSRRLVVLLFEGACRFLYRGREALQAQRYEEQSECLLRVQRIYGELSAALDRRQGGKLVASLRALYGHIGALLQEANMQGDLARLDEALGLTEKLCRAWKEAETLCQA